MTRAAKIVYGLALIIGLSVGGLFGFLGNKSTLKSIHDGVRLTAPNELDAFSFLQYRHADVNHAKAALLTDADLLQRLEAFDPNKGEKFQLTSTYTRLALLEDSLGNAQASREYMAKARNWYRAAGGREQDYSDSQMKAASNAFDERREQIGVR